MFRPEHYTRRACELEHEANRVGNLIIRASYLDLAQAFREMATLASLLERTADAEAVRVAERMVGKDSGRR
jgi:hypothetical protein